MWEERKWPLSVLSYLCTTACVSCPGSDEHDCMCGKWQPMQDCLLLHGWVRVRDRGKVNLQICLIPDTWQKSHLSPGTLFQKAKNFQWNTLNDTWDGLKAKRNDNLIPKWDMHNWERVKPRFCFVINSLCRRNELSESPPLAQQMGQVDQMAYGLYPVCPYLNSLDRRGLRCHSTHT